MKIFSLLTLHGSFAGIMALIFIVGAPIVASAATKPPTCSLELTTLQDEVTVRNNKKENIVISEGDEIEIEWKSKNARKAVDADGETTELSGSVTYSPDETTTYSYRFTSGSKKTTCAVTVNVASGDITDASLRTTSSKPTLSGTAMGTKVVRLTIRKDGGSKVFYKSREIRVRGGKWKAEITKKLPNGTYDVEMTGSKDIDGALLATETLTIGPSGTSDTKTSTTLAVSLIPLLSGGTARASASVPISYLQITNIGKETASVKGFGVKQNGSASTKAIIGLTAADDMDTTHGSVGGLNGMTPFKDGQAFVPVDTTIAPGTMRLFTIKAVLTSDISSHIGKQLMLDVTSVSTNAATRGIFPIRGTTWTIGY